MSAIAHVPGATWAAAHRAVVLALTVVLMAAAVTVAALLLAGGSTDASPAGPAIPSVEDTCSGARVGSPC
jgi:hypothetical protein